MRIGIIGTGRMARVLLHNLASVGGSSTLLWGRDYDQCSALTREYSIEYSHISSWPQDLDIILLAVSDRAIGPVSKLLPAMHGDTVVAHLSGATLLEAIHEKHHNRGVLWPIDSFSDDHQDMQSVPIMLENSSINGLVSLRTIASELSAHVYEADHSTRARLHAVAVIVNNFSTHLLTISEELLAETPYDLSLYRQIWQTTLQNSLTNGASQSQTGPAARHDQQTIEKHIDLLPPIYRDLYLTLTASIQNTTK